VLAGATSETVAEDVPITLGVTDTARYSDDVLALSPSAACRTISILRVSMAVLFTGDTGTWTGTAAQFNALQFTSDSAGTWTFQIYATTTGTDGGSADERELHAYDECAVADDSGHLHRQQQRNPYGGLVVDADGDVFARQRSVSGLSGSRRHGVRDQEQRHPLATRTTPPVPPRVTNYSGNTETLWPA